MAENENNPHPYDENPEKHLGHVIDDPWDDPEQTDWGESEEEN